MHFIHCLIDKAWLYTVFMKKKIFFKKSFYQRMSLAMSKLFKCNFIKIRQKKNHLHVLRSDVVKLCVVSFSY